MILCVYVDLFVNVHLNTIAKCDFNGNIKVLTVVSDLIFYHSVKLMCLLIQLASYCKNI